MRVVLSFNGDFYPLFPHLHDATHMNWTMQGNTTRDLDRLVPLWISATDIMLRVGNSWLAGKFNTKNCSLICVCTVAEYPRKDPEDCLIREISFQIFLWHEDGFSFVLKFQLLLHANWGCTAKWPIWWGTTYFVSERPSWDGARWLITRE